jgi:hypothetical protein
MIFDFSNMELIDVLADSSFNVTPRFKGKGAVPATHGKYTPDHTHIHMSTYSYPVQHVPTHTNATNPS